MKRYPSLCITLLAVVAAAYVTLWTVGFVVARESTIATRQSSVLYTTPVA
jgi:uncharacterized membrane protein